MKLEISYIGLQVGRIKMLDNFLVIKGVKLRFKLYVCTMEDFSFLLWGQMHG